MGAHIMISELQIWYWTLIRVWVKTANKKYLMAIRKYPSRCVFWMLHPGNPFWNFNTFFQSFLSGKEKIAIVKCIVDVPSCGCLLNYGDIFYLLLAHWYGTFLSTEITTVRSLTVALMVRDFGRVWMGCVSYTENRYIIYVIHSLVSREAYLFSYWTKKGVCT